MTAASERSYCGDTVRDALDLIGGKWSMLVLWELMGQDRRYADLQRQVAGISQKVLSSELRSLVAAGLVEREVAPTVPPQVTYRVTPEGRGLEKVFSALHSWGLHRATGADAAGARGAEEIGLAPGSPRHGTGPATRGGDRPVRVPRTP